MTPSQSTPSSKPEFRLGIDLGGTKIEIIVLDETGNITQRKRTSTPVDDYAGVLQTIKTLIESIPDHSGVPVGIGTPGSISRVSPLMRNSNSTCLNNQPLLEDLNRVLARPVRIANDANCFALSEASDGAAADGHIVFGVILGTGVGGGICIEGSVLDGANGISGEWGHNPIPQAALGLAQDRGLNVNRACFCGRQNCVETWLSGPGLVSTFKALAKNLNTETQATDRITNGQQISELAQTADDIALATIDLYIAQLGIALAHVVNFIDPTHIVLGGGLSNMPQLYTDLATHLRPWVFSDHVATRIVQAKHGDSSGVRGAAWLWP